MNPLVTYLTELRDIRSTGAGVKEVSYYPTLKRALTPDEAREGRDTARRIAALLLLEPALDENYHRVKAATYSLSQT
jgi:hypothetical protein